MFTPEQALYTDEQWDTIAKREGVSVAALKAEVILSNEILEKILEEELALIALVTYFTNFK